MVALSAHMALLLSRRACSGAARGNLKVRLRTHWRRFETVYNAPDYSYFVCFYLGLSILVKGKLFLNVCSTFLSKICAVSCVIFVV